MKQYYAERNGLIADKLSLSLDELKTYFIHTYRYFSDKDYFEVAFNGIYEKDRWGNNRIQVLPPSMAPSPQVFFSIHTQDNQIWPIYEYAEYYDEKELFTVIEILYDHIAKYDYRESKLDKEGAQAEFAEHINNILRAYKDGYYLVPTTGFIMEQPNQALKEQLDYDGSSMPDDVFKQLQSASQRYYRFDADMESKKKAIASLADILENVREEAKNLFNSEFNIPKNDHDKIIFSVVNGYNIRHDNQQQKTDYSKDIWYDWMMQYYTSTVIAFHRVKEANKNSIFNLKRPLAMNQILFDVLHSESKNIHSEYMTKCYFFELSVICSNIPILSIKSFSTGERVSSRRFLYLSYSA